MLDITAPVQRPTDRRRPGPAARRRRTLLVLAAAAALLGAASPVEPALLWAALGVAGVAAGFSLAAARARHLAVQREMATAFAAPGGRFDWAALEALDAVGTLDAEERDVVLTTAGPPGTAHFLAVCILGWALTPFAVAARLLAGDRRVLEGDGALARLVALQRRSRAHSMRALAVSVATTAGVGAVGSTAAVLLAPAASAAPAPGTYVVAPGDTLSGIAAAHGTTVAALAAANHLANPDLIFVGQVLALGGGAGAPAGAPAGAGGGSYTVAPGDTLGSIAAAHGTTVAALAAANHLANPDLIFVGQVISLGGGATSPAPATTTAAPTSGTYVVQPGDTLGAIAAAHGTTAAALAAANHLANPDLIFVGQVISLGGGATSPAPATTTAAPVPPPAPAPAAGSLGARALQVALAQVGKPYQWGGAGPWSFDCSGLVMYAYEAVGVALPHYTVSQYQDTARISESQLAPGDLVFYGGSAPYHVTIYEGGGEVVTADTTGTPVRVEPITWDGTPSGFGRVG